MRPYLVILSFILSAGVVTADEVTPVDPVIAKQIVGQLVGARDDLNYEVIAEGPIPGFYQVQVESGPVLYVTADGKHFFDGNLYQVHPGRFVNVRELALSKKRRELFSSRRTDDMIIFAADGETRAIMNVFTDVDCGYCRKLHEDIPTLNGMGIEVRYLAFPRTGPGTSSYNKLVTAWCSDNQQVTLTRLKQGHSVGNINCPDNPVDGHYKLGIELGVTGTPAVMLMDGTLIPGYQPAAAFERIFGLNPDAS